MTASGFIQVQPEVHVDHLSCTVRAAVPTRSTNTAADAAARTDLEMAGPPLGERGRGGGGDHDPT